MHLSKKTAVFALVIVMGPCDFCCPEQLFSER